MTSGRLSVITKIAHYGLARRPNVMKLWPVGGQQVALFSGGAGISRHVCHSLARNVTNPLSFDASLRHTIKSVQAIVIR